MIIVTFSGIERAVRAAWAADTCDPHDLDEWNTGTPSRGQCGTTAMVLNDLLGGDLMLGEVHARGRRTGLYWWNRFAGIEVDLTREQFGPDEKVTGGRAVERPPGPPRRCRDQYETLRRRVLAQLGRT